MDQGKLFAAGLMQDRREDLKVMPTRLTAKQLGEAIMIECLGVSLLEAAQWMPANFKKRSPVLWAAVTRGVIRRENRRFVILKSAGVNAGGERSLGSVISDSTQGLGVSRIA